MGLAGSLTSLLGALEPRSQAELALPASKAGISFTAPHTPTCSRSGLRSPSGRRGFVHCPCPPASWKLFIFRRPALGFLHLVPLRRGWAGEVGVGGSKVQGTLLS